MSYQQNNEQQQQTSPTVNDLTEEQRDHVVWINNISLFLHILMAICFLTIFHFYGFMYGAIVFMLAKTMIYESVFNNLKWDYESKYKKTFPYRHPSTKNTKYEQKKMLDDLNKKD
jgi:hypothetical protein